ncbi:MAG TPA: AAA family ATPase [Dehalococcoidia bacterium]|nr:AAA family ATPase [Dehalococcoidia bacterium]
MYKSISIKNFRGLGDLRFDDLAQINLIAGQNDVGKTSLLEALWIAGGAYNPSLALRINSFRGLERVRLPSGTWAEPPWIGIFRSFHIGIHIELETVDTRRTRRRMTLRHVLDAQELSKAGSVLEAESELSESGALPSSSPTHALALEFRQSRKPVQTYFLVASGGEIRVFPPPPGPPFQTFFHGARFRSPPREQAEQFSSLEKDRRLSLLVQALSSIDERLRSLSLLVEAGETLIHADIGLPRPVPLPLMGEGMVHLASIILQIANAPGGVVLIDEIENGFHHSVINKVWTAVAEASRLFNTQVFATTHSYECIAAASRSLGDGDLGFTVHRLERIRDKVSVRTYTKDVLKAALEAELEIR